MRSIFFRRLIVTALWELTFLVWIPKLRITHESSIVYGVLLRGLPTVLLITDLIPLAWNKKIG